jgi:DNA repair protein RadC
VPAPRRIVKAPIRKSKTPGVRAYTNDLAKVALAALPLTGGCADVPALRERLTERLPFNSANTRRRYANYILNRFFPRGAVDEDLVLFAQAFTGTRALKDAVFYLTAAAEPILAKIAGEVVWSALAEGSLPKTRLYSAVEARLHIATSAVKDTAQAIARTYGELGLAEVTPKALRLRLREGDPDAFVFVLHREFPEPGMYDMAACLDGPLHRWLLWPKEWIRQGLHRLREQGLLAKVSEIDNVRQFSTQYRPAEAMRKWLELREATR